MKIFNAAIGRYTCGKLCLWNLCRVLYSGLPMCRGACNRDLRGRCTCLGLIGFNAGGPTLSPKP